MKRTEPEAPYLSFCLAVRDSVSKPMRGGWAFEKTLRAIRERAPQAEIVVVDTGSSDKTPEVAKRYADVFEVYLGPEGDWDKKAFGADDMAAAKQRAFDLASGRWRGWIDDDDRLPGPEEAERLLKLNNRWEPGGEEQAVGKGESMTLEDAFRKLEELEPEADCVWCPYLYQRDENDHAIVMDERERFVRWTDPPRYHWRERAHEILVPIDPGYRPLRVDFDHLLFVHERDFSPEGLKATIARHYAILREQYQAGERTTRRCLYLAAYAPLLEPKLEEQYLGDAVVAAKTPRDRYQALVAWGKMFARRGLYFDALEAYGAAQSVFPELPDAWLRGGELAAESGDTARAIEWLERGVGLEEGQPGTEINARLHVTRYPTLLAEQYRKQGKAQIEAGAHEPALESFKRARDYLAKVIEEPAVGADDLEALYRFRRVQNELRAQQQAISLARIWRHLLDNDEPLKARRLLEVLPHHLQDHPIAIELEQWARKVDAYCQSKEYERSYNSDEHGQWPTPEGALKDPAGPVGDRVTEVVELVRAIGRGGLTILDVGSFDGNMAIPILCQVGDLIHRYVAVELDERARKRLIENAAAFDVANTVFTYPSVGAAGSEHPDLVIACEILEHVPEPVEFLLELRRLMGPETKLFASTPWGSFDLGHPPTKTIYGDPRCELGHLRAMTAWDVRNVFRRAGLVIEELHRVDHTGWETGVAPAKHFRGFPGPGLHVLASSDLLAAPPFAKPPAAVFAVPSALWDWNGRTLHQGGMGYSESAITFLSERLVAQGQQAEVYGPVPSEDVHRGVGYWKREQIRHLGRRIRKPRIVVSRSPLYGRHLDRLIGEKLEKVLWLQDAYYPELSEEVARDYAAVVVVSYWHREVMQKNHGVPEDLIKVIPNFLPPGLYERPFSEWPEKQPGKFVYASSPDRGLIKLLKLWPRIRQIVPDATLDIFYGWRGCQRLAQPGNEGWISRFTATRRAYDELKHQEGVFERGMVPQEVIAEALYESSAWLYPTGFTETWGTIAAQARAAGAVPVTTALAGLNESAACDQAVLVDPEADDYDDQILDGLETALARPLGERRVMAAEALEYLSLETLLPEWLELLG